MSASHEHIFAAVGRIPSGRVATYGQVARVAGYPGAARLAGYALARCPPALPWHRVVNARGRIALPAGSTLALRQRRLLEAEGVIFVHDRADLERYGWSA